MNVPSLTPSIATLAIPKAGPAAVVHWMLEPVKVRLAVVPFFVMCW
jgi:hypothetical protein